MNHWRKNFLYAENICTVPQIHEIICIKMMCGRFFLLTKLACFVDSSTLGQAFCFSAVGLYFSLHVSFILTSRSAHMQPTLNAETIFVDMLSTMNGFIPRGIPTSGY